MICQNCKKEEATTRIRRVTGGLAVEYHLCSGCALALGFSEHRSPLEDIFEELLGSLRTPRVTSCEKCGSTLDDIIHSGKAGCENCYEVFGDKLSAAIEKAGVNRKYCGKVPHKNPNSAKTDRLLTVLRAELAEALNTENYEQAALLRDKIRLLEAVKNG